MKSHHTLRAQQVRRGHGLSLPDPSRPETPLEFPSEDHVRERQVCPVIDGLALSASAGRLTAQTVLRFVNKELNVPLPDDAEDLFPLSARHLDAGCDRTTGNRHLPTRFAGRVRRHLAAENAILLPIARARLTPRDLKKLSRQMKMRRGLPPVAETPDAA